MWYVAQVSSGQEVAVRDMCKQMIDPGILQDCFVPEYETMRKVQGKWQSIQRKLFPGYLFLVTETLPLLLMQLKHVPANVRLLGQGVFEGDITPLSEVEKDWIVAFMDETHCVRMSEAVIEGDTILITHGPLLGREAIIKKIDRHKRRAQIEISMFGRTSMATIGLEVIKKD